MKRIAVCYHGLSYGENFKKGGLPVTFEKGLESFQRNVVNYNKNFFFDIFFHSWSNPLEEIIKQKYSPIKYLFEPSKKLVELSLWQKTYSIIRALKNQDKEYSRYNNIYSRWYSFQKAFSLAESYSKNNNVIYDYVLVLRFDMVFLNQIDFSKIYLNSFTCGRFIGYHDGKNFVADDDVRNINKQDYSIKERGYPFNDEGLQDFFFGANMSFMKDFSNIYFELKTLIRKAGLSNHKIALHKFLELEKKRKTKLSHPLEYITDYYLERWL